MDFQDGEGMEKKKKIKSAKKEVSLKNSLALNPICLVLVAGRPCP